MGLAPGKKSRNSESGEGQDIVHKGLREGHHIGVQQKEEQARKRKRENDLKKLEERIESLEGRSGEIDSLLSLPEICTDPYKCAELGAEKAEILEKLDELYEQWEELAGD